VSSHCRHYSLPIINKGLGFKGRGASPPRSVTIEHGSANTTTASDTIITAGDRADHTHRSSGSNTKTCTISTYTHTTTGTRTCTSVDTDTGTSSSTDDVDSIVVIARSFHVAQLPAHEEPLIADAVVQPLYPVGGASTQRGNRDDADPQCDADAAHDSSHRMLSHHAALLCTRESECV
jgi:hypothetical protein